MPDASTTLRCTAHVVFRFCALLVNYSQLWQRRLARNSFLRRLTVESIGSESRTAICMSAHHAFSWCRRLTDKLKRNKKRERISRKKATNCIHTMWLASSVSRICNNDETIHGNTFVVISVDVSVDATNEHTMELIHDTKYQMPPKCVPFLPHTHTYISIISSVSFLWASDFGIMSGGKCQSLLSKRSQRTACVMMKINERISPCNTIHLTLTMQSSAALSAIYGKRKPPKKMHFASSIICSYFERRCIVLGFIGFFVLFLSTTSFSHTNRTRCAQLVSLPWNAWPIASVCFVFSFLIYWVSLSKQRQTKWRKNMQIHPGETVQCRRKIIEPVPQSA